MSILPLSVVLSCRYRGSRGRPIESEFWLDNEGERRRGRRKAGGLAGPLVSLSRVEILAGVRGADGGGRGPRRYDLYLPPLLDRFLVVPGQFRVSTGCYVPSFVSVADGFAFGTSQVPRLWNYWKECDLIEVYSYSQGKDRDLLIFLEHKNILLLLG